MAEPTTATTYAAIRSEVGQFLGWSRDSSNWSVENRSTIIDALVLSGVRQVVTPPIIPGERAAHEWTWLKPIISLTTTAPYDTGTIEVVAGVVTLTGGTFPSGAAAGELLVDGVTYTVASRDGNTQITLDDTTVAIDAGSAYSLIFPYLTLPDDYGGILGPITFRPGASTMWPPLEICGEYDLRRMRQHEDIVSTPRQAAVRTAIASATAGQRLTSGTSAGQRWEMMLWPIPDAAYELSCRIRVNVNSINASHTYPPGGPALAELYIESCLAIAEHRMRDNRGVHWENFLQQLQAAVAFDRQLMSPERGRMDRDGSDCAGIDNWHELSNGYVTYVGHAGPY